MALPLAKQTDLSVNWTTSPTAGGSGNQVKLRGFGGVAPGGSMSGNGWATVWKELVAHSGTDAKPWLSQTLTPHV